MVPFTCKSVWAKGFNWTIYSINLFGIWNKPLLNDWPLGAYNRAFTIILLYCYINDFFFSLGTHRFQTCYGKVGKTFPFIILSAWYPGITRNNNLHFRSFLSYWQHIVYFCLFIPRALQFFLYLQKWILQIQDGRKLPSPIINFVNSLHQAIFYWILC